MKSPKVTTIMTAQPICCSPRTTIEAVGKLMLEHDFGAIPVTGDDGFPIGIITDRDIVMRTIAAGKDPMSLTASDCMSAPVTTITEDATVDDCCEALELQRIRRVVVVNRKGKVSGMVSQADIAGHVKRKATGQLLRSISSREPDLKA